MALSDFVIGRKVRTTLIRGGITYLTVTELVGGGAQGKVFRTDNSEYLLKVWDPEESDLIDSLELARQAAEKRYSTFTHLRFRTEKRLSCLPLEYVEVVDRPAYLMERAIGVEMSEGWAESLIKLDLLSRMRIAHSLAQCISRLHLRKVIHADIRRDNFFFDPATCQVQVLDIDGGGYWGMEGDTEHFQPTVAGSIRYMAPELLSNSNWSKPDSWGPIWRDEDRRVQPDLWSLAVLSYDIIVDRKGPFPRSYFGGDAVYSERPEWPHQEQRRKFEQLGVDKELIAHFTDVFCARNRARPNYRRVEAVVWVNALQRAIERRTLPSVRHPKPKPTNTRSTTQPKTTQSARANRSPWDALLSENPKLSVSVNTIDFSSDRYGKKVVEVSSSGSTPLDVLITGIPSWLVVAPVAFRCEPKKIRSITLTLLRASIPEKIFTGSEWHGEQISCRLDISATGPIKSNHPSVSITVKATVSQPTTAPKRDLVQSPSVQKPKRWRGGLLVVVMFLVILVAGARSFSGFLPLELSPVATPIFARLSPLVRPSIPIPGRHANSSTIDPCISYHWIRSPVSQTVSNVVTFEWEKAKLLPVDCGFEVRVWQEGEPHQAIHDVIHDNRNGVVEQVGPHTYRLQVRDFKNAPGVHGRSGQYFWTVAIVRLSPDYVDLGKEATAVSFVFDLSIEE